MHPAAFHKPAKGKKCGEDAIIELYVVDPAVCTRGNNAKRNRNFAVIILIWRSLGLRLAFSKAKRGLTVPWIGNRIRASREEVQATIHEDRVTELKSLVKKHMTVNVISMRDLRSFIGKCGNSATLLITWRPSRLKCMLPASRRI